MLIVDVLLFGSICRYNERLVLQDGIGNMKITPNGIQLNGEAMVLDSLMTSQITSKRGQPLTFDSSQNVTLTARDTQGRMANRIFLGKIYL